MPIDIPQQKTSNTHSPKIIFNAINANTLQLIIIFAVSIAVYFNALFNSFVFDDSYQVLDNRWIRDISFIPTIFSHSVWGFDTSTSVLHYYRPLMHLIYMFNYHVFGLNPLGFHLVNILFHAGVSVMVFIIVRHLLMASSSSTIDWYLSPAFIAAILFAIHPIHTEVVTWVAAVPELAFTFFCLLSLFLYMRSEEGLNSSYVLSLVSFALALLSKETALTLPIIIFAYDYLIKRNRSRSSKEYLKRYLPYTIIIGSYLFMRSYGLRDVAPVTKVFKLDAYTYVINVLSFLMHYIEKLILPIHLNAYHIFRPISSIMEPKGLLVLTFTIVFLVLAVVAFKKSKLVFWCLVLVIVPLIPTFYIIGNSEVGISERYLYLPSFGFVLLVALLIDRIRVSKPQMTLIMGIILSVLIGLYAFGTTTRNGIWKDDYSFWTDTSRKSPDSAFIHRAFGGVLFNRGNVDEALSEFLYAIQLNPSDAIAHTGLGATYNRKGFLDKSIEHYQIALQLKPSHWEAYYGLGVTYIAMGKLDQGIEQIETSLRLKPDSIDAHEHICSAYMQKGLLDLAMQHCQMAVELNPADADAHYRLGLVYKARGMIDDAIEQYEAVVRLMPTAAAHSNLGILYDSKDMRDKAIEQYQAAIGLQPDFAKAYNNLGIVYARMGLVDKAVENLENAVRIDPNDQGFRRNLERVYEMNKARNE